MNNVTITMTQKKIAVSGNCRNRNAKPVYNLTTGDIYASQADVCVALGVSSAAVCLSIQNNWRVKGNRLVNLADVGMFVAEIAARTTELAIIKAREDLVSTIRKAEEEMELLPHQVNTAQAKMHQAVHNLTVLKSKLA